MLRFQIQLIPIMKISMFACFALMFANPCDGVAESISNKHSVSRGLLEPAINWNKESELTRLDRISSHGGKLRNGYEKVLSNKDKRHITSDIMNLSRRIARRIHPDKIVHPTVAERVSVTAVLKEVKAEVNGSKTLICRVKGHPLSNFWWNHISSETYGKNLNSFSNSFYTDPTHVTMTLNLTNITEKDSGRYKCFTYDSKGKMIYDYVKLVVMSRPKVTINSVIVLGANGVYLDLAVHDNNAKVEKYSFQYMKNGTQKWQNYTGAANKICGDSIVKGLQNHTRYKFRVVASNSVGDSKPVESNWVTTWKKDSDFVPNISSITTTLRSIKITWSEPPNKFPARSCQQRYKVRAAVYGNNVGESHYTGKPNFVFGNLKPNTTYSLKVAACTKYNGNCGNWSVERQAFTSGGESQAAIWWSVVLLSFYSSSWFSGL